MRDLFISRLIQFVEVFHLGLRHQQEPGKDSVVFQQQMAGIEPAEMMTAGGETRMQGKAHAHEQKPVEAIAQADAALASPAWGR